MIQHEFRLWNNQLNDWEWCSRLALGGLIEETERKTFKPEPQALSSRNKSGSIGFMDYGMYTTEVPKLVSDGYAKETEYRMVFMITTIGIEPEYWRQGFATKLIKTAEEKTLENKLDEIMVASVGDSRLRKLLQNSGYHPYNDDYSWIKKLK